MHFIWTGLGINDVEHCHFLFKSTKFSSPHWSFSAKEILSLISSFVPTFVCTFFKIFITQSNVLVIVCVLIDVKWTNQQFRKELVIKLFCQQMYILSCLINYSTFFSLIIYQVLSWAKTVSNLCLLNVVDVLFDIL